MDGGGYDFSSHIPLTTKAKQEMASLSRHVTKDYYFFFNLFLIWSSPFLSLIVI
jgi:hypothetical protein